MKLAMAFYRNEANFGYWSGRACQKELVKRSLRISHFWCSERGPIVSAFYTNLNRLFKLQSM